ncbi:MAG: Holliday junction branch migration protein RuvA [Mollicutes bacterium]|mgnify:CR=1 FL=1|nr:Holliday junction branch migration protein RuvA [Mollicutes bacterium]
MYEYIKGIVKKIESNYIVLENNGVGYLIYTGNPYSFNVGEEYTVYVYQYVREDEISLYGFKTMEEKELFLKLISVNGLGCKMALPMLATGSINGIIDAIERENILYLKKFPKIGDKIARQIILDLKGKLVSSDNKDINRKEYDDLIETLKALGYKSSDIMKILPHINNNEPIEKQVKDALRLLLK